MFTDIFLFSQNLQIKELDSLLKINNLVQYEIKLNAVLKDTSNYINADKIAFLFIQADYYNKKEKTDIALKIFKKLENYYFQKNDSINLSNVYYEISALLQSQQNLNQLKESKLYLDKYFKYSKNNNNQKNILKAYMAYAGLSLKLKDIKQAIDFYDKAKKLAILKKDSLTLAKTYNNKGVIFKVFIQKTDSARFFYKKALNLYYKLNQNNKIFNTIINISSSYKKEKNYQEAIKWLKKADSIPISSYKLNSKKFLYKLMSKNYEELADFKNANLYLNKYIAYKDSVDIKAQNIAISDIQTKYETAKKEKDIIKLKAEKDKQQNYMIIGAGTFVFIIVLTVLAFYNQKKKKDLAEKNRQLEHQKLESLIKDQELKTLDAIVQGQEKERKRIAEDLHDNLGSKLAVLKLQFDGFLDDETTKSNVLLTNKLKKTSSLLEDTYQTVRSMSHVESKNKVQQSLLHAVKVLTTDISNANKLEIEVIDFGLEKLNNNKIEIITLRIIQELLTNIIKYAKAEKVTIDITFYDNLLGVIISDDGIGFDTKLYKKEGLGLITIKEKVLKLNGSINIDSSLGNGTTVIIEIPVKQKNI